MERIIQKTGKILLASAISLTTLSVGGVAVNNNADAADRPPTAPPSNPGKTEIKKVDVTYSASEVKNIDKKYSSPSGGAAAAASQFASLAAGKAAPQIAVAVGFANIGGAQWKSDYAKHFKNAANNGTGLTITYKVDVHNQKLEGISFSA